MSVSVKGIDSERGNDGGEGRPPCPAPPARYPPRWGAGAARRAGAAYPKHSTWPALTSPLTPAPPRPPCCAACLVCGREWGQGAGWMAGTWGLTRHLHARCTPLGGGGGGGRCDCLLPQRRAAGGCRVPGAGWCSEAE
ncbi:hypothetical protein O3P69_002832 [Scylla paramamosain]|uniref:Uncharacterized protein n=1 Tax=Scylla paramamosain TaxID=85552 RepID=A0AAW0UMI3_SCYPA